MNINPSLKILVCYHKPATLVENEIFVPIHVGRAQTAFGKDGTIDAGERQWLYDHMIGDDTGENISDKTLIYSELTALYWAWKNYDKLGNPDYIGLMHYRRFLIFHPEKSTSDDWWKKFGGFRPDILTEEIINKYLSSDYIRRDIEKYDIYLYERPSTKDPKVTEGENRASRWACELRLSLDCMKEEYPELYETAQEYLSRTVGNRCNLMVMRREAFFEYCEFIFEFLGKLENRIAQLLKYCWTRNRILGLVAEWTLGIWALHQSKGKYKVKGLPEIFVKDPIPQIELYPAFSERNIPLFCACDNAYALVCGVMLQSVIAHASAEYNYDIIVLDNGISEDNVEKLKCLVSAQSNFSIRFYKMKPLMYERTFYTHSYLSSTVYCKLFAPSIFSHYDKILYLDADTALMEDVSLLYHAELNGQWIGAVLDYDIMARKRGELRRTEKLSMEHIGVDDVLYQYFNSGLLVFDLAKCREMGAENLWLVSAQGSEFENMDQDILNLHCKGHVCFLDSAWNVPHNVGVRKKNMWRIPRLHYEKWLASDRKAPKLIHYSSAEKPWKNPSVDMAQQWWSYARQTPFYEELLFVSMKRHIAAAQKKYLAEGKKELSDVQKMSEVSAMLRDIARRRWLCILYQWYRLRSHTTFGKLKQHYWKKKRELKTRLVRIRDFLHGF